MYFCILFFIFRVYEVRTNSLFWRPVSVSDDVGGDLRKKPQIFSPSLSLPSFSYNIDIFIICQLKVIRGWILVKKHFTNSVCFLFIKLVLPHSHEIYNLATLDFLAFDLLFFSLMFSGNIFVQIMIGTSSGVEDCIKYSSC